MIDMSTCITNKTREDVQQQWCSSLRNSNHIYDHRLILFPLIIDQLDKPISDEWKGICWLGTCKPLEEGCHAHSGDDGFVILTTVVQAVERGTLGLRS